MQTQIAYAQCLYHYIICTLLATLQVLAEHDKSAVSSATLSAITAASKIGGPVTVLVIGGASSAAARAASTIGGVSRVLHVEDAIFDHAVAEVQARAVLDAQAKYSESPRERIYTKIFVSTVFVSWCHIRPHILPADFTHIVAVASNDGKNIVPRVAALRDVAPITDVTAVHDEATFDRPMYAGNAIARVRSGDALRVLTVRPTAFEKAKQGTGAAAPIESIAVTPAASAGRCAKWVSDEVAKSERPELTGAPIVISGGRALKSAENFKLLYNLADKLGAAVGASRAAVDAGSCSFCTIADNRCR